MYRCKNCGAYLDAGERCSCDTVLATDNDASTVVIETFTLTATRCRRCGGVLTSAFGLRNGIGQCCQKRENAQQMWVSTQMQLDDYV